MHLLFCQNRKEYLWLRVDVTAVLEGQRGLRILKSKYPRILNKILISVGEGFKDIFIQNVLSSVLIKCIRSSLFRVEVCCLLYFYFMYLPTPEKGGEVKTNSWICFPLFLN